MAESSIWWTTDGTGDGNVGGYTQAQLVKEFRVLFVGDETDEGVAKGFGDELEASGVATAVSVAAGAALVYGFAYFNTAAVEVAVPTPAGNTRIDRIVLQVDWTAQTVRVARIAGTEGSGAAPALTQGDGTTWEVPLCQASITTGGTITVTDQRVFLHPNIEVDTAMLEDAAVTAAKLATDAVETAKIKNANVTAAKLATDAVETAKIKAANVTLAKMAANSVDSDQYVDGSVDTVHVGDLQITTAKLAADSVDDTKAGARVPQFYRRKGGHSTNWFSTGSTDYTPTSVRMQAGSAIGAGGSYDYVDVTFPVAFSGTPIIIMTAHGQDYKVWATSVTASGFRATSPGHNVDLVAINWLAIGPE